MNRHVTKRRLLTPVCTLALVLGAVAAPLARAAGDDRKKAQAAGPANVRDHRATGDGATDDGPAIKAAFDAAPDGTGVHFPSGTYFLAHGVIIKDRRGLTVTGDPGALLKAAGGKSKLILSFEKCHDITVTGLRFDLNGVTHFGPGLAFVQGRRIRVHANHFFDGNYQPKMTADRYAIAFRLSDPGHEDIWITENLIEHLQVEVDTARRVHILNNRSIAPELACGFGSFTLKKDSFVEDIQFVGNHVEDPQAYGICVAGDGERDGASMRRILIANNTILCRRRAPMLAAIMVGTRAEKQAVTRSLWEDITVAHNLIWYGPKVPKRHQEAGIRVQCTRAGETLARVRITGNTVVDQAGIADVGIDAQQLQDAVISDNAVYGTRVGVRLAGGWTRSLAQGNRVSDVPREGFLLEQSGGENRFLHNFVYGKCGTPFAFLGLHSSDAADQAGTAASRPAFSPGAQPSPAPSAPAQPAGKSDVTREMTQLSGAAEVRSQATPAASQPAALPAKVAGTAGALEDSFDSNDAVEALRGYLAAATRLARVEEDKKEGRASLKTTWTSTTGGGAGGVRKTFGPMDLTGRTFSVWVKPVAGEPALANISIALFDADDKRAQVWYWFPHHVRGWTKLTFTVGRKGDADSGGEVKGDLTRIGAIRLYGTTRGPNQTCELLWDDLREVKP